jgi:ribosomal protein L35AE/L33A
MKGIVIQFRRGRKTYTPRHFLIEIADVDSREKAGKFVGKDVVWTSPAKKEIKGKVASAHGNKGVLRCIFEAGLPGQSIGTEVVAGDSDAEVKKVSKKIKSEEKN